MGNYPFVVYLSHKGRQIPDNIRNPLIKDSGCLVIYLDNLKPHIVREKKGRYEMVLRDFVASSTAERSWLFHPREIASKNKLDHQLEQWLHQQEWEYYKGQTRSDYVCAMCRSAWSGYSRDCESCGTHLFTSERKHFE